MYEKMIRGVLLLVCSLTVMPAVADAQSRLDAELQARAGISGRSRVIARFDREDDADRAVDAAGGRVVRRLNGARVLDVSNSELRALERAGATMSVDRVALSTLYRSTGTIGSEFVNQTLKFTGKGVGVAVIDSGIGYHDDLYRRGSSVAAWVDFVNGASTPYDATGATART